MLIIENQEHFDKVREFARSVGADVELQKRLDFLAAVAAAQHALSGTTFQYRQRVELRPRCQGPGHRGADCHRQSEEDGVQGIEHGRPA